jgi:membrane associated rhomboid family serine protease
MPMQGSPSYIATGPGPMTPAVRALIIANVAGFLLAEVLPRSFSLLTGLVPALVLQRGWIWQPVTYMFMHGGLFHLLFNMLALWMFGMDLERVWGTRFFVKYYFVTGIGAAATTILVSLLPYPFARSIYLAVTVGASGAIYGLLLAYAMMYPSRPIFLYMIFPIPAKVFVIIMGAISLFSSISAGSGGVAHATHLGGIVVGYAYLKMLGGGWGGWWRTQRLRWRLARSRRRFDVHEGGRPDHRPPQVH